MNTYIIYGGGSPLRVESYHPEVAEAEACRDHGFDVSNLVTVEAGDLISQYVMEINGWSPPNEENCGGE